MTTDSPESNKPKPAEGQDKHGSNPVTADALAAQILAADARISKGTSGLSGLAKPTVTVSDTLLLGDKGLGPQLIRTGNSGVDAVANFGQGAARNLGGMLKGTMQAVANPLDTIKGLGHLGSAVVDDPSIVKTVAKDFGSKLVSGDIAQAADAWGSLTAFTGVTAAGMRGMLGHGERAAVAGGQSLEQATLRTETMLTSVETRVMSSNPLLAAGEQATTRIPTGLTQATEALATRGTAQATEHLATKVTTRLPVGGLEPPPPAGTVKLSATFEPPGGANSLLDETHNAARNLQTKVQGAKPLLAGEPPVRVSEPTFKLSEPPMVGGEPSVRFSRPIGGEPVKIAGGEPPAKIAGGEPPAKFVGGEPPAKIAGGEPAIKPGGEPAVKPGGEPAIKPAGEPIDPAKPAKLNEPVEFSNTRTVKPGELTEAEQLAQQRRVAANERPAVTLEEPAPVADTTPGKPKPQRLIAEPEPVAPKPEPVAPKPEPIAPHSEPVPPEPTPPKPRVEVETVGPRQNVAEDANVRTTRQQFSTTEPPVEPVRPAPEPAPVRPAPEPAPVRPAPEPVPPGPEPTPVRPTVEPAPTIRPGEPAPTVRPGEPAPTVRPGEPSPTLRTQVEPNPIGNRPAIDMTPPKPVAELAAPRPETPSIRPDATLARPIAEVPPLATPSLDRLATNPALGNSVASVKSELAALQANPTVDGYNRLTNAIQKLEQEAKNVATAAEQKALSIESKATLEVARQTVLINSISSTTSSVNALTAKAQEVAALLPSGGAGEAQQIVQRINASASALLGAETQGAQLSALQQLKSETATLQGLLKQASEAQTSLAQTLQRAESAQAALMDANKMMRTSTFGGQIKEFIYDVANQRWVRPVELSLAVMQVTRVVNGMAEFGNQQAQLKEQQRQRDAEQQAKSAEGTAKAAVESAKPQDAANKPAADNNAANNKEEARQAEKATPYLNSKELNAAPKVEDFKATVHKKNRERISGLEHLDFFYVQRAPGAAPQEDQVINQNVFRPQIRFTAPEQQEKTAHLQFDWRKTRLNTDGAHTDSPLLSSPITGFKPNRIQAVRGLSGTQAGSGNQDQNGAASNLINRNYAFVVGPGSKPNPTVGPGKEASEQKSPDRAGTGGAQGATATVTAAPVTQQDPAQQPTTTAGSQPQTTTGNNGDEPGNDLTLTRL